MKYTEYKVSAKVWLYPGVAGWHFVTIPKDISEDIKKLFSDRAKSWGSLPVEITLGKSKWTTSIFPDKKEGAYLLPLKKEIRIEEKIRVGDTVNFLLELDFS